MLEKIKTQLRSMVSHSFFRFVIVGCINTGVDILVFNAVLFLLVFDLFENELIIAKVLSFIIASANSFVLNAIWTFGSVQSLNKKNYGIFLCISIVGALLNVSVAYWIYIAGTHVFPFQDVAIANIALVGAVVASLLWNYFGYKKFVFSA